MTKVIGNGWTKSVNELQVKTFCKSMPHVAPTFQGSAFNCPLCDAYARMYWFHLWYRASGATEFTGMHAACCSHCKEHSYWIEDPHPKGSNPVSGRMVLPTASIAPLPHSDMPAAVRTDFQEARSIAAESPRGAAALLRLAIQELTKELGEKGENLNTDIGSLVQKGLPVEIQQALDIVRVVGNNAVHPGELSADDVAEVAATLFELINQIVEDRISRPAKLKQLFDKLPSGAKAQIQKRDNGGRSKD